MHSSNCIGRLMSVTELISIATIDLAFDTEVVESYTFSLASFMLTIESYLDCSSIAPSQLKLKC